MGLKQLNNFVRLIVYKVKHASVKLLNKLNCLVL